MNFGENIQGRGFRGRVVNRAIIAELNGGRVWNNVFRVFLLPFPTPDSCVTHHAFRSLCFEARALETVHLQLVRLREPGFRQKLADILPLVTLQLQNLAVLRMLNYSAIACEFLLTCPHNFL